MATKLTNKEKHAKERAARLKKEAAAKAKADAAAEKKAAADADAAEKAAAEKLEADRKASRKQRKDRTTTEAAAKETKTAQAQELPNQPGASITGLTEREALAAVEEAKATGDDSKVADAKTNLADVVTPARHK